MTNPPARLARPGRTPHDPARRQALASALQAAAALALPACAAQPTDASTSAWTQRLEGDTVALLGEVHDNPLHHRLRAQALRRACESGWRPALVMEQFDLEQQPAIERSRTEQPRDARRLIEQAGRTGGWSWRDYEPFVALALQYELPLWAGNLSRAQAARVMREGYEPVLGPERMAAWNLQRVPDAAWQAAQEKEIDLGHCGALPKAMWSSMARAQFARDAALAHLLRSHGARGAVLLAGNGHVRRDIGVPRWLDGVPASRTLVVGFVELEGSEPLPGQYDVVVKTERAPRSDPCEGFRRQRGATTT